MEPSVFQDFMTGLEAFGIPTGKYGGVILATVLVTRMVERIPKGSTGFFKLIRGLFGLVGEIKEVPNAPPGQGPGQAATNEGEKS